MKYTFLDLIRDFENGVDISKRKDGLFTRIFSSITTRVYLDENGLNTRTNRDWYDGLLYIKKFGIKEYLKARKEDEDFYA